jgi:hypothetical protein
VDDREARFTALYDAHYRGVLGYALPRVERATALAALAGMREPTSRRWCQDLVWPAAPPGGRRRLLRGRQPVCNGRVSIQPRMSRARSDEKGLARPGGMAKGGEVPRLPRRSVRRGLVWPCREA